MPHFNPSEHPPSPTPIVAIVIAIVVCVYAALETVAAWVK